MTNQEFAEALVHDVKEGRIMKLVDAMRTEALVRLEKEGVTTARLWEQIVSNAITTGGSARNLISLKKKHPNEYNQISNWTVASKSSEENFKINAVSIPIGSRNKSRERKANELWKAKSNIQSLGSDSIDWLKNDSTKILADLESIESVGPKVARNIMMDMYHPAFRNGFFPIDSNWKEISKKLGLSKANGFNDPRKDEKNILAWKQEFIPNLFKDDWEFDRFLFQALQKANNETKPGRVFTLVKSSFSHPENRSQISIIRRWELDESTVSLT